MFHSEPKNSKCLKDRAFPKQPHPYSSKGHSHSISRLFTGRQLRLTANTSHMMLLCAPRAVYSCQDDCWADIKHLTWIQVWKLLETMEGLPLGGVAELLQLSAEFSCIDVSCGLDASSRPAVSSFVLLNTGQSSFKRKPTNDSQLHLTLPPPSLTCTLLTKPVLMFPIFQQQSQAWRVCKKKEKWPKQLHFTHCSTQNHDKAVWSLALHTLVMIWRLSTFFSQEKGINANRLYLRYQKPPSLSPLQRIKPEKQPSKQKLLIHQIWTNTGKIKSFG